MSKITNTNRLSIRYPEIATQWHPTKNGILSPFDITSGSCKKVWWLGVCGHEWDDSPNHRIRGRGCPFCRGLRVDSTNCLANILPEIATQWHPTKNGSLTPYDVTAASGKMVWWKCDKGLDHEWKAPPNNLKKGQGCPCCNGKKVVLSNCLMTTHPEIAVQWHPTKNGILTPYDVTAASNKKVWWQCDKESDHIWEARIANRGCCNHGCAFCAGKQATTSNCLMTTHPEIAAQWHPTKNGILTPYDVLYGSDKKVWWICPKGHEYYSSIGHRCISSAGCAICCESKGEKMIASILDQQNLPYKRQACFKTCKHIQRLRFDFVVKANDKTAVLIEYNGHQHYRAIRWRKDMTDERMIEIFNEIKLRDRIKKEWAEKRNIPLLVIPYWEKDDIKQIISKFMKENV